MFIKRHMYIVVLSLIALGLICPALTMAEDVLVITNNSIAAGTVNADTVKRIYSGNMSLWPDNTRVDVTVMEDAPFHGDFLKTYVGKTSSQFKATWKKMVFTGKGTYPKKFDNVEDLINYVAHTKGAIGYIDTGATPQGVNIQK